MSIKTLERCDATVDEQSDKRCPNRGVSIGVVGGAWSRPRKILLCEQHERGQGLRWFGSPFRGYADEEPT